MSKFRGVLQTQNDCDGQGSDFHCQCDAGRFGTPSGENPTRVETLCPRLGLDSVGVNFDIQVVSRN